MTLDLTGKDLAIKLFGKHYLGLNTFQVIVCVCRSQWLISEGRSAGLSVNMTEN